METILYNEKEEGWIENFQIVMTSHMTELHLLAPQCFRSSLAEGFLKSQEDSANRVDFRFDIWSFQLVLPLFFSWKTQVVTINLFYPPVR